MINKKFKAVIFDLDGTLVDSVKDIARAANLVLKDRGLPPHDSSVYRQRIGWGQKKLLNLTLPELEGEELDKAEKAFLWHYKAITGTETIVYPGIPELLNTLADKGLKLFVYTNKNQESAQKVVDQFFPVHTFQRVFGSRPGLAPKPDPAAVARVVEATGFNPKEIVFIGDSEIDLLTAQAGGMAGLAVLWGYRSRTDLEHYEKMAEIERADEILSWIL